MARDAKDERCESALSPWTFSAYPLSTVSVSGWMQHELELCGRGLGGHLFHFYRFVKGSTWLGGTYEYTALNEAAPYWYNYIVPLAYSVEDPELARELRGQASYFLDHVLQTQHEDGWLGPENSRQTRGIWARCLLLLGMVNHAEAEPARLRIVVQAMFRFTRLVHKMLTDNYTGYLPADGDLFDPQWFGVARAHELAPPLEWLYDRSDSEEDRWLIRQVLNLMFAGARLAGRDWTVFFREDSFPTRPSIRGTAPNFQHGVNVAQGLRYAAHLFRMQPVARLAEQCREAVRLAFRYHGTASGTLTSDEYVGGVSPQRGAEVCCTVELIVSLTYLYRLFGDCEFADRAETAAFNALPAAIAPDWWSHQYVTQMNQPWARELQYRTGDKPPFFDVCRYANVFGLEPEFVSVPTARQSPLTVTQPCCTVNHSAALPKLGMHAFLSLDEKTALFPRPGILHAYLVDSQIQTALATVRCRSSYPFSPLSIRYDIDATRSFDFYVRVPKWAAASSTVQVSVHRFGRDETTGRAAFRPNTGPEPLLDRLRLHRIAVEEGDRATVDIELHADVVVERHEDGSASVRRGPLLFALDVPSRQTTTLPRNYKDQTSACMEVKTDGDSPAWMRNVRDHSLEPVGPWAVALDLSRPLRHVVIGKVNLSPGQSVWLASAASECIEASVVDIAWPERDGTAAPPRDASLSEISRGPGRGVRLVPYGCAKLHMAQLPVVEATA